MKKLTCQDKVKIYVVKKDGKALIYIKDTNFIVHCGNRVKNIGMFTDEEFEKNS